MHDLFSDILRVSVQGGVVILAVMLLRLALKKAPKRAICLLWLLAGLRLLVPVQIESPVSLQPDYEPMTWGQTGDELSVPENDYAQGRGEILDAQGNVLVSKPLGTPSATEGAQGWGEILDAQGNVLVRKPLSSGVPAETAPGWVFWIPYIWLAGVAVMGLYTMVSYWNLKRKVADAVILEEGVWVTNRIDTPFLLGFVHPKIYLPMGLTAWAQPFVLAHERVHLHRKDHWWKLLGFTALAVHWFNPLVWLGYVLLCRDLEMACDESVVQDMDVKARKAYSAALVSCSSIHRSIAACPIAFGEISVKERVKHVLYFKKPGFWITVLAVAAAAFVAVSFLTSPGETEKEILRAGYAGPGEEYEYYHATDREKTWEEDILFLAETLLTEHPRVSQKDCLIHTTNDAQYSNELYDPELRKAVIDHVDTLIPKLAELTDDQVVFEMQATLAMMRDLRTTFNSTFRTEELVQLLVEPIYSDEGVSFHAIRVPESMKHLIYGKLTAINDFSLETVIDRIRPYVSCENDYRLLNQITSMWNSKMWLYTKAMMETIGVVEPDAESVTLTFETENGIETADFPFMGIEEYWGEPLVDVALLYTDQPQYRHLGEEYFWYEILEEENTLYANLWYLTNNDQSWHTGQFLAEVAQALENSQEKLKLVMDFRYSGGTNMLMQEFMSFADRINQSDVEEVYILVDGSVKDYATVTAYWLRQWISGAQIVGSPTGSGVNLMTNDFQYTLPNSGYVLWVANQAFMADPNSSATTLIPDILIYQTLEDYKNGVDTVFEAVVHGSFERELPERAEKQENQEVTVNMEDVIDLTEWGKDATVRMIGANRVLIQGCIQALEALQSRDSIHLTAEATFQGIPGETGSYQEYWQSGECWMRVGQQLFEDPLENYTVGNLSVADTQYRFGHAGTDPVAGRTWTLAEEEQLWHRYWLMDFDLSEARILSLEKWDTEDGYAVKMELGRKTDTGVYGTQYRRVHTYYLDWQGNLLRLVEEAVDDPITVNHTKVGKQLSVDIRIFNTPETEIAAKLTEAQKELPQ